jgi:uncharacterized Fe-S center protein
VKPAAGGALKNISIASSEGKSWIHSGGKRKTGMGGSQNVFLESMAEAASVMNRLGKRIVYIVMNHLSIDCDCSANPAP